MCIWLIQELTLIDFLISVSECNQSKPCIFYDADTKQVVTNYTSVSRLKVDCSRKGLYEVPDLLPSNTVKLYLKGNFITRIPAYAFSSFTNITLVNLSENRINKLDLNSFRHLETLEVLYLAGNKICLPKGYPKGIFCDLESLKILKTFHNECPSLHARYPDDVFKDVVSLEHLALDTTIKFTFGQEFKQLTNLVTLEASSLASSCENYKIHVKKESFCGLSNRILDLTLRGCAYRTMENGSFDNFPHLNPLNLACTRNLDHKSFFKTIYSMRNANLETLILDGMLSFGKSSLLNTILKAAQTLDSKLLIVFLKKLLAEMRLSENLQPFCHPNFLNLRRLSLCAGTLGTKVLQRWHCMCATFTSYQYWHESHSTLLGMYQRKR